MNNQTIAAISTPLGPGGIGIIRISGPDAYAILKRLFVRKPQGGKAVINDPIREPFLSHRLYYGHILEPVHGYILDEVLAVYMKAPKSFTREDVVEIHSHSGFVVLDRILSAVVDLGAGLSGPGEFSKRAFLNGRIDLSQAEAVIDLINAPCDAAIQMAGRQMAGGLKGAVEKIGSSIVTLRSRCEASIEFPDDAKKGINVEEIIETLESRIVPKISVLIQNQKDAAVFRDGALLSIAGIPNVGKSSLLNKLVEKETAIVSEVPGTTRDVIREYFSINGVPVVVCDTAGIHDTLDPVECIGIQKARDQFHQSDIILLVLESTRRLNAFEEQLVLEFQSKNTIAVINKDDLAEEAHVLDISRRLGKIRSTRVSAKTGKGIHQLKAMIFDDLVSDRQTVDHESVTPNLRQRKVLEHALGDVHRCVQAAKKKETADIVSGLLNNILLRLDEISGNREQEDLYDHIFSQFCIGK